MVTSMYIVLHMSSQIQGATSALCYENSGLRNVFRICAFAQSVLNIQINVCPLLLLIWQHYGVRPTPHMLPNAVYTIRFALWELSSLSNPAHLQYCRFRLKYINQRTSVSKVDQTTIRCALYSTYTAKYRVHHPVCATWTLVYVKSG